MPDFQVIVYIVVLLLDNKTKKMLKRLTYKRETSLPFNPYLARDCGMDLSIGESETICLGENTVRWNEQTGKYNLHFHEGTFDNDTYNHLVLKLGSDSRYVLIK